MYLITDFLAEHFVGLFLIGFIFSGLVIMVWLEVVARKEMREYQDRFDLYTEFKDD